MLGTVNQCKHTLCIVLALHIFISLLTSQVCASADPKSEVAEDYRNQGYAQQQKGNYTEALTFYSKALSLGLNTPVIYNDMGILYEQLGLASRAEEYYLQALKQDKTYLPTYTNLAYFYLQRGSKVRAEQYFRMRYELAPSDDPWAPKIEEELGVLNPEFKQKVLKRHADELQADMKQKAGEALAEQVRRALEHAKRGEEYSKASNYRLALMEYDKALVISPKNPAIVKARKNVMLKMSKESIKEHSDQALRMLEAGNSTSARTEVQKMLTSIPSEQVLNSKK